MEKRKKKRMERKETVNLSESSGVTTHLHIVVSMDFVGTPTFAKVR